MKLINISTALFNVGLLVLFGYGINVLGHLYGLIRRHYRFREFLHKINLFRSLTAKSDDETSEKYMKWLRLLAIVSLLYVCSFSVFRNDQIGSFFEKQEYTAKYYVYVFPDPNSVKCYRLKAEISAVVDSDENSTFRNYWLDSIYWPNGNVSSFDHKESLVLGQKVNVVDNDGRYWDIVLTKDRAE